MIAFDTIRAFARAAHPWHGIIIHHSATPDGRVNDWDGIRNWHTGKSGSADASSPEYNPYVLRPDRDIGYHFGIEKVADQYQYQVGRSLSMSGAHCVGQNTQAIGICVVGNFDIVAPSVQQYWLLSSLCRELMHKFDIDVVRIEAHHVYALYKTCPGRLFSMDLLKQYITGTKSTKESTQ